MKLLVALTALVLAACSDSGARQEKKAEAPQAVTVAALSVAPQPVPVTFDAVGRTEGSREVQVRARIAGILEKQMYGEGDSVKAGAALFRIERAPFEIELAQARAQLAQERSRNEQAAQEVERLKGLTDKRAISQKEADLAGFLLRQSGAAVQVAQARVRQAELNLSYTAVNAPIAGVTGRALQSVGTLVQPNNESALLTTITQSDPIWVRFSLSEAEYSRLRNADEKSIVVTVELSDGKAYPEKGRLNFSGSSVDATTGTVQMRAELPNHGQRLLAGQYVRARVTAGTQQAILVPQTAVLQNETGRFVWVVGADGKAQARQIRPGEWLGENWIVLEGLKAGDMVITDNLARLRPGIQVKISKAG